MNNPTKKYNPATVVNNPQRTWPSKQLLEAPRWCSTDLRDGNQALSTPMNHEKKALLFDHLITCGFKEIEVAFPSASQTDFKFVRYLIEQNKIPDNVWIQVITQARPDLIERTLLSLQGASRAIVHLYNATAPLFRELVFKKSKSEIIEMAVLSTQRIKRLCDEQCQTQWILEYSPETFCFTELEFSLEICEAVKKAWQPSNDRPLILNLPATVEVNTPNVYADQIEKFRSSFSDMENVTISIHPHNDRGTGVAAAELAQLAGATRVEGCVFGNGERTGNVDLAILALNLYTQGIDPKLDFSDIRKTAKIIESCTNIPIHPRHPYSGELVFTAFSGSHQDAIKKGFEAHSSGQSEKWNIPYLPLDPKDVGCSYEEVIKVNSQSGKSGPSWMLEQNHGLKLPTKLQLDFSKKVQNILDKTEVELSLSEMWDIFRRSYGVNPYVSLKLIDYQSDSSSSEQGIVVKVGYKNKIFKISGKSNGLLSTLLNGLNEYLDIDINIVNYSEHTLGDSTHSKAISYIECESDDNQHFFGVSIENDTTRSSLQATLNAISNLLIATQQTHILSDMPESTLS